MPTPQELIVAELLYLNYESKDKSVYMYINSMGTSVGQGQTTAFETEAFAIADTMSYVGPDIETICIGVAYGTVGTPPHRARAPAPRRSPPRRAQAAMLLANGKKGTRACLPNASVMLHQPRAMAQGQASDLQIKAREVLIARRTINSVIAEQTGQTLEQVTRDSSRTKYLTPEQAQAYGIVDKVLRSQDDLPQKPSFLSAL